MLNQNTWTESKFKLTSRQQLIANRKDNQSCEQSIWIITELVAELYSLYIPVYAKGRLLDLGCGNCPFYGLYKQYISSVFCIDWENSFYPNKYADQLCDLNQPLNPIEDNEFDTVILSDVLEHISNPQGLVKEINRILTEGGVFIFNVPFLHWIHESPYDFYRYTEFILRKYLEDNNFEIIKFEIIGGAIESWSYITARLSSYIPFLSLFLPSIICHICFGIARISWLKRKLSVLNGLFPLGYFIIAKKNLEPSKFNGGFQTRPSRLKLIS